MRQSGKRRGRSGGIVLPACLCLGLAMLLLAGSRLGGEQYVQKLLGELAASPRFVQGALALETGFLPGTTTVHTAAPAALSRTETPPTDDEDAAEAATVIENTLPDAETAPETPAPANGTPTAVTVANQSGLDFDLAALQAAAAPIRASSNDPQVLVYHTHATEAYTPYGTDTYSPSGDTRTTDTNQNVVRVGEELCNVLEANGIKTVHLTDLNDYPAYNGSYGRSLTALQNALQKYPTVQITIDLHRDAILNADGTPRAVAAMVGGQTAAQLMFVMGTDASGLQHDHWRDNLGYAARLQSALNADWPGLMRPINVRQQRFNMHLLRGSMLLEVGSSGNTLQQALTAVRMFGKTLAEELRG